MSKFYAIEEAAEILGITVDLLSSWIAEGKATATRRSGSLVLRQQEVQKLMSVPPVFSSSQGGAYVPTNDGSSLESLPLDGSLGQPSAEGAPGAGARVERLAVTPRNPRPSGSYDAVPAAPSAATAEHRYEDAALPSRNAAQPYLPLNATRPGGRGVEATGEEGDEEGNIDAALPSGATSARSERKGLATPRLLGAEGRRRGAMMRRGEDLPAPQNVSVQAAANVPIEQILEKAIDPIARTQARLIKYFNELKDSLSEVTNAEKPSDNKLEAAIARLETRLDKLQAAASLTELKSFRRNTEASIQSLEALLHGLENTINSRTAQAGEESSAVTAAVVEELKNSLQGRNRDIDALKEELTALRAENRQLQDEHKDLLGKNIESEKSLAEALTRESIERPRLVELEQKLSAIAQEHGDLQKRFLKNSQELEVLTERSTALTDLMQQIDTLRPNLDAEELESTEFVEKLITTFVEKSKEFSRLEIKYEACEEENSTLQLLIGQLQRGGAVGIPPQLQADLEEAREAKVRLQEEISELNAQIATLTSQSTEAEHKLEEANNEVSHVSEDFAALTSEHAALVTEQEQLHGELEQLNSDFAQVSSERDMLSVEQEQLRDELDKVSAAYAELLEQGSSDTESSEALATLREDYDHVKAALDKTDEELSTLQDALHSKEQELEELREEHTKLLSASGESALGSAHLQEELDQEREAHDTLKDETVQLREAYDRLLEESKEAEAEKAKWTDEMQSVYDSNTQIKEECENYRRECEQIKTQYAELKESQGNAGAQLEETAAALEQKSQEYTALAEELEALRQSYSSLQEEHSQSSAGAEASQEEIVHLTTQLSSLKVQLEELDVIVKESHDETAELTEQLEGKDATISELNEKLALVQANMAGLSERMEAASREKKEQELRLEQSAAALAELQSQLAASNGAQEEQEALRAEHAKQVSVLEGKLSELSLALEAERAKSGIQLEAKDKLFRDAQEGIAKLESERNRLLKRQNTLQAKITALRAEIDEAKDSQQDFEAAREGEARLKGEIASLRAQLDEVQSLASDSQAKQALAVSQSEAVRAETEELKSKLAEYQEQIKTLQYEASMGGSKANAPASREMLARIASLEADASEKDRLIQEVNRERAGLRDELDNSQRAYYELQQQHDKEKREWSEILARQIKGVEGQHSEDSAEGEPPQRRAAGGWRLFNKRGNS